MAEDVIQTLRRTLATLATERQRIGRQMAALETALNALNGQENRKSKVAPTRKRSARRRMSAAARKLMSQRMKASWAKRRSGRTPKGAGKK